ncbi:cold-shock protein [Litoreibacter halocynthiae]|uniref:cold-shock protein n=1 Tax=Litoreibacter halocynthiae TaxID=1242689 RepID=UPI002490E8CA|nr:cold shock domain-containing protein [Litoreibacter halocynthiae]
MSDLECESSLHLRRAGLVKWFDPVRGFGFVIDDETGDEILLHANTLRCFGQNSVSANSLVELEAVQTEQGYQAHEVISIVQCEDVAAETINTAELHSISEDYVAARVKWFDVTKGFGFVNVFGSPEDHFVHVRTLHQAGLETVAAGEAICVRLGENRRGSIVVEARNWAAPNE